MSRGIYYYGSVYSRHDYNETALLNLHFASFNQFNLSCHNKTNVVILPLLYILGSIKYLNCRYHLKRLTINKNYRCFWKYVNSGSVDSCGGLKANGQEAVFCVVLYGFLYGGWLFQLAKKWRDLGEGEERNIHFIIVWELWPPAPLVSMPLVLVFQCIVSLSLCILHQLLNIIVFLSLL